MSDIAIRVEHVSKQYRIGKPESYKTLRDTLTTAIRTPFHTFTNIMNGHRSAFNNDSNSTIWALKDVSFEVKKGDVIGIIGRNGAGKSTLLKILSQITEPAEGRIEIHGRVGSLLEVGTGFHSELTGRENIYLYGVTLGMKKSEIDCKFDEIVAFAEIGKFIDTPMKHYSSGMYMRLAFAVAAHLDPDILLVDEVLAVGDVAFQNKCLGKMGDVANDGRTVLFVSHNFGAISSLCQSAYLFDQGQLVESGITDQVIMSYLKRVSEPQNSTLLTRANRRGNGLVRFLDVNFYDQSGARITQPRVGETLIIALRYNSSDVISGNAVIQLVFKDVSGQRLFICKSRASYNETIKLNNAGEIRCRIPKLPLTPGRYYADIWCKVNEELTDYIKEAFFLDVATGDFFGTGKLNGPDGRNLLLVEHTWEIR